MRGQGLQALRLGRNPFHSCKCSEKQQEIRAQSLQKVYSPQNLMSSNAHGDDTLFIAILLL